MKVTTCRASAYHGFPSDLLSVLNAVHSLTHKVTDQERATKGLTDRMGRLVFLLILPTFSPFVRHDVGTRMRCEVEPRNGAGVWKWTHVSHRLTVSS